ncbi:MAG: type II secretion system protein [Candidatus Jorgensenbacteria bacterium]
MLPRNHPKSGFIPHITSKKKSCGGFTLVELLIYGAVFSVTAVFLVNILTAVTQTQVRQTSVNEVNQQLTFVANTVQRLVRESAAVENAAGVSSTTLVLRMPSSTLDKTFVYASGTAIYLEQGSSTLGVAAPSSLTNDKVTVTGFSVKKFENPGGLSVVQFDIALSYNSSSTKSQATRTWSGAVARISAATFDSSLLPATAGDLDVGGDGFNWNNAYFSGDVTIAVDGQLGIGVAPSALSTTKIKSTGDVGFSTSTYGLILVKPDGSGCYRVTVSNAGALVITATTCP